MARCFREGFPEKCCWNWVWKTEWKYSQWASEVGRPRKGVQHLQRSAKPQGAQFGWVWGGMVEKQDEAAEVGWSPAVEGSHPRSGGADEELRRTGLIRSVQCTE